MATALGDVSVRDAVAVGVVSAPPRVLPVRSNVLQFSPRRREPRVGPLEALRRLRRASLVMLVMTFLVTGAVAFELGGLLLVVAPAAWLVIESALVASRRHGDEWDDELEDVVKRHVVYGMAACVAGVFVVGSGTAVTSLYLFAALAVVSVAWSVLVRCSGVRRLVGVGSPASVLVVADRLTVEDAVADRAGLGSSVVVGVCLVESLGDRVVSVAGVPVLGGAGDVVGLVEELGIHEVSVRLEAPLDSEWLRELGWALEALGVRLSLVTKLRGTAAGRVRVSRVGSSVVLGVSQARPSGLVRQVKAVVEAVVALVMMVVALPVLVVCVVAVRLDSSGPAFFRQTRVRDGGRTFTMVKLRTMGVDAEARRGELEGLNEVGGGLFKMEVDPRVTRVGRVLRKLSLDELPQLWNVVRGEMSLVGPRPALPSEVASYDVRARRRLGVKPGLTGLWQVSGRSRLSWEESVALDIDYVDNWSAGRDVRIAVQTVRAVVAKDGAY